MGRDRKSIDLMGSFSSKHGAARLPPKVCGAGFKILIALG